MATTETISGLNIRPMDLQDVDEITVIENSAYFAPWPKAAFSASLGIYPAFVLEKHQEIVGYAIFSAVEDEAHILNLVVKPACQHQGYGRIILQFVLASLVQNHIKTVSLEVAENNAAALRLYQSLGFSQQGKRKQYYQTQNGLVDALILVYKPSYTFAQ